MNTDELRVKLRQLRIRERSYSLEGGSPEDRYCIERSRGGWAVYYSERGSRFDERWFKSEDEGCDDLLRRLLADATTRARKPPFGSP